MIEKLKDFIDEVQQFTADTKDKAEELRLKFLSRKGILNEIFAEFKNVAPAEKREYGQRINALKQLVEQKINEAQESLRSRRPSPTTSTSPCRAPTTTSAAITRLQTSSTRLLKYSHALDSPWRKVRRSKTTTTTSRLSTSHPNTPHAICRTPSL